MKIGIGEWKMRNGEKAIVAAHRHGVVFQWVGRFDVENSFTFSWREDGRLLSYRESKYDIISPWTSPIAPGHNPGKLTEEQVGVKDGWRLLDEDEILGPYKGIERVGHVDCWTGQWEPGNRGICKGSTYRTRLSREELAALDKPKKKKKRLIRVEELPISARIAGLR